MKYRISLLSFCILISACGGGGGSDNGNDNNDNNDDRESCGSQDGSLKITTDNYATLAAEAYDATYGAPALAEASAVFLDTFTRRAISGAAAASSTELAQQAVKSVIARKRLARVQLADLRFSQTASPAVINSGTIGCPNGGQYLIRINDADNNNFLSAGDIIELDFDNCRSVGEDATIILKNQLIGVLESVSNNTLTQPPYQTRFNYDQFTMQITDESGTQIVSVDGDLRELVTCSPSAECAVRTTGDNLTLTQQSLATNSTLEWRVLDYAIQGIFNDNNNEEKFGGDGVLYINPSSDDSVNFETAEENPFRLRYSDDNPFVGEESSRGCNSRTQLTTLDNENVRLELDEDGDGVYETTTTSTWDELAEERQ